MSKLPVLGYYSLRGWAGSIRLLLAHLEIPYEEKLYPNPTPETGQGLWATEKYSLGLDFPNMPYWIDEGRDEKLTETKAIMKHICRRYDSSLLGRTELERSRANMLEEVLWDMWNGLTRTCLEFTDTLKNKFLVEADEKKILLSKILGTKNFLLSNEIIFVDFLAYEILHHYIKAFSTILDDHPNLQAYLKRIESVPSINKYIDTQGYIEGPCYSYKFKAKI